MFGSDHAVLPGGSHGYDIDESQISGELFAIILFDCYTNDSSGSDSGYEKGGNG